MKKTLKYVGVLVGILVIAVVAFTVYLAVYPDLSEIRQQCEQIEVGMTRSQAEVILGDLLTTASDRISIEESQIYLMDNGVDCDIDFDSEGVVTSVSSAVDSL